MDIKLIKDYLKTQKIPSEIIEREIKVEEIDNKVISIIGPRRAGKTYFLYQLMKDKEDCLYINFESIPFFELNIKEIYKVIFEIYPEVFGKLPKYVFLDEIQVIKNWNVLVRTLLDRGLKIFITGSSSKLLSKEIATNLRGRSISYLILPFSFREYLKAKKVECDPDILHELGKLKNYLNDYLNYGGFPEVVLFKNVSILKEYAELSFFKDFVERFEIQNIELAKFLFYNALQNFSCETSVRKIANKLKSYGLKFDIHTVYKYFSLLEETSFIFKVRQFSFKSVEREFGKFKLYVCDTGVTRIFSYNPDVGKLMENCVFLELYRKKNLDIFYYKTRNGKEIDFVVKRLNKLELIEVTYEFDQEHVNKVLKAMDELDLKEGLVITWDDEDLIEEKGRRIKVVPLWKWLLD